MFKHWTEKCQLSNIVIRYDMFFMLFIKHADAVFYHQMKHREVFQIRGAAEYF